MQGFSQSQEQDELIKSSWNRCRKYGLDHHTTPFLQKLNQGELSSVVEEHQTLVSTTNDEVLPYYENILSNTQCLIVLTDNRGQLLDSWGDQRFLNRNMKEFFTQGVSWAERYNGTNAIGTVLATGSAVQVAKDEHFLKANRFMIGSAAPILNSNKEIIGVLDVSSDAYLPHAHTFGLVKLMSQSVENRLIMSAFHRDHFVLTFNANLDNIDSAWSGLIVFDEHGTVISANRRAELILGHDIALTKITNLFNCSLTNLKNHPENLPIPLMTLNKYEMLGIIKRPAVSGIHVKDFRQLPTSANQQSTLINAPVQPRLALATPIKEPSSNDDISLDRIGYGDEKVARCIRQAERVIEKEIPILIHGETGVGKEVFVKALHEKSSRQHHPLVAVNCAAIPSELVESELFGYEKGAFTGANAKGGIGFIRKANKGTLFLDEIGEMPLKAQARLLRVLQERKVTPLGSTESYPVDIKVISATNRSLKNDVETGLFRQDLYYRVSGLNLELPPLRARTDKIDLFKELHRIHRAPDQAQALSDEILELFQKHPWPGNIRQLASVIQIALAMADDEVIRPDHLPDDFFEDIKRQERPSVQKAHSSVEEDSPRIQPESALNTTELDTLEVYQANKGNISRTAKTLGISRNTLYKRLKDLGIK
ncbi:sigma-54-dependent Fis family transcriptional regulator [Litoribrevibacter albus]|uniref:Sigma-54-dependent Fis family transcriptional regulator n=1 Tax=Litoribrevibacter albus TaxID=1473156 RepID=A0AA37S650_9GAMM|nr:sigma-54-dependent Fis family transcriptional regulator [Litoribrevibacter albus]GLQ29587.1 sigma-54-dependent Fis family transcriptional regulator [Litoribrevibacter albus]